MLKLTILFTLFNLTFAQYWFGQQPPPQPPPPPSGMPPPGMHPPGYPGGYPGYPGYGSVVGVVKGPTEVEVHRTVHEKIIPNNQPATLCVCTEASNCRVTPQYRCMGSSVILEGGGGDGVCCHEADIIC